MTNKATVTYDNASIAVGMKIGRILSRYDADRNRHFELVVGEIKAIRLGKKKSTVEIDRFYPQDLEDIMTDIDIYTDFLARGIMTVDTFFIADDETVKRVNEWIEWAKGRKPEELDPLLSGELEENNNEH